MTDTTARVKRDGKHFEILVDLEEALKFREGKGDISQAVLTDSIFHNLKSGENVSKEDLEKNFGTTELMEVAKVIIKNGEIVKPTDYINKEQDKKYKQVVDFLSRNAASPSGTPYTPDRIEKALHEANVNVKNKPIEGQINEIMDQLCKILPIKIVKKKLKLRVPAQHTGVVYGTLKEFMKSESWQSNGDLECTVEVPSGIIMDFYDKINNPTKGSILSEEIKG
jgi:ribosome maturation protein SDO1